MSASEEKTFINPARVERIIKSIAEQDASLARRTAEFYIAVDKCCIPLQLVFPNGEVDYIIRVRAIDPFVSGGGDGTIIGATIYLGISNNYIDNFINTGQIVLFLRGNNIIESEAFIYKNVDSVIVRDDQLTKLSEWIRIAKYHIEKEVPRSIQMLKQRTITRNAEQKQSPQKPPESSPPSESPKIEVERKVVQPPPKTKIVPPQILASTENSTDPLETTTDKIPEFNIVRTKSKVIPPNMDKKTAIPDPKLFATKKEGS